MFLTRIKQYLLNKNYGSFLFEFLILIFGVYISLQANQWQIDRENREIEFLYLERLQNDFNKSSQALAGNIERIEESLESLTASLSILTQEKRNEQDYDELFKALQNSSIAGSFSVYTGTFEELKDTGYMRIMESTKLRESLGNVSQKKSSISRISEIRNLLRSNTFPVLAKYIKPEQGNRMTFDAELVEKDTRELYIAMSIIRSNLIYDLEDSQELLSIIDRSLIVINAEITRKSRQ